MKYCLITVLVFACLLGCWQWRQLQNLEERETALRGQLSVQRRGLPAASHAEKPEAAPAGAALPAPDAALPLTTPVFFDMAMEISALESTPHNSYNREIMHGRVVNLFSRLAATPLPVLKEILDQLPGSDVSADGKKNISLAIVNLLVKAEPSSVATLALRHRLDPGSVDMAVRTWGATDPAAASAWLEKSAADNTLPPGVETEKLRLSLLAGRLVLDPAGGAANEIAKLPSGQVDKLFAETAPILTTRDQRQAFLTKIATLPGLSPEAPSQFIHQVARKVSFEAATALLTGTTSLTPAQADKAAVAAASARIDASTPARADWLLQHLSPGGRGEAISSFITTWTGADFNGAASWLRNRPASPERDTAVAAFAPLVASTEPPSAVDWAVTISSPEQRRNVLANLYQDWHAAAPEEANAYFQSKGLPLP